MRPSRLLALSTVMAVPAALFMATPASAAPDPFAGLSLPANLRGAVVTTVTTARPDVPLVQTLTTAYDGRGNMIDVLAVATNDSGDVVNREEVQFTYNSQNQQTMLVDLNDGDGDGPRPPETSVSTTTYDKKGFALSLVRTVDQTSDGIIDARVTFTFSSDHRGRTLVSTTHDDTNGDGVDDQTSIVSNTYDGRGHLTRTVDQEYESGALTGTTTQDTVYGAAGRVTSQTVRMTDASGSLLSSSVAVLGYDSSGNETSATVTHDDDGDGQPDVQSLSTQTYDSARRLLHTQSVDVQVSTQVLSDAQDSTFTYDSLGHQVGQVVTFDQNADGNVDITQQTQILRDGLGRPVHTVFTSTNENSHVVTFSQVINDTYDTKGRISKEVLISTEGSSTSVVTTTYAYVSKTTLMITVSTDGNGDGVVDSTYTITRTIT